MYQENPSAPPTNDMSDPNGYPADGHGTVTRESAVTRTRASSMWPNLIYTVFSVIVAIIAIRVIMKLFRADPSAPFAQFFYGLTQPLVAPFRGLFPNPALGGGVQLEINSLFAIVIYALIGWVLVRLFMLARSRSTATSIDRVGPRAG